MSATQYDVFISYSSKDERSVKTIHRFLESYKSPKGVCPHGQRPRIKVFRDKSDQGAAADYESAFHAQIEEIPAFLFAGSKSALDSVPVQGEVKCALRKQEPCICLAWVDHQMSPQFPEEIAERYPRALYADFRMLGTANPLSWWLRDRKRFRFEALRIVASLLSQKTKSRIDLDHLIQRERQRQKSRLMTALVAMLLFLLGFTTYYASTPEDAWHYTGIGTNEVAGHWFRIDRGSSELKLLVVNEWEKPWEDEESGDSGFDSDFTVYQLDERGQLEGALKLTTFGVERGIDEASSSLDASGVFSSMTKLELLQLADQATRYFYEEENRRARGVPLPSEISNIGLHSKHTLYCAVGNEGLCFVAARKDTNPFDPIEGGLFRSKNGGQNWESLDPIDDLDRWESFDDVVCHPNDEQRFAVSLATVVGTNMSAPFKDPTLLPSAWFTNDGGDSWTMLDSGTEKLDAERIDLIGLTSSGVFALVSNEIGAPRLVLYGKRSFWARVFQRFDDL